jgi:Fic family protein
MLFQTPPPTQEDEFVLGLIEQNQTSLRHQVADTRRWFGLLRRVALARSIRGSNSIEGYHVTLDDAFAAVGGEEPLEADQAAWRAVQGYRDAMTYVLEVAKEPDLEIDASLLKSLHFMMISYDLSKRPGRYRKGDVFVVDEDRDETVYEGPAPELVPGLMVELVHDLLDGRHDSSHVMVQAAMAHVNLVMIHPFNDGNGRMARALQSLVLIRGDVAAAPEFCSIEEYLGANELAYYEVLKEVGAGAWHPERDASAWIRFTLTAHYRQTLTVLRRAKLAQRFWAVAEREVGKASLHERTTSAVAHTMNGFGIRNAIYREMEGVSEAVASRDLKALVDAGILQAHGEKRGRYYSPVDRLREEHIAIRKSVRSTVPVDTDPYALAREGPERAKRPEGDVDVPTALRRSGDA